MAVHLPLSYEAQLEARVLMLSSNNILLPSNGRPGGGTDAGHGHRVVLPDQSGPPESRTWSGSANDTKVAEEPAGQGQRTRSSNEIYADAPRYSSYGDVEMALAQERVVVHDSPVWYWVSEGLRWVSRRRMRAVGAHHGRSCAVQLDHSGRVGLHQPDVRQARAGGPGFRVLHRDRPRAARPSSSTRSRTSASGTPRWVESPSVSKTSRSRHEKREILDEADEQVARFQKAYASGFISNGERYNKVIDTWTHANNDVADAMVRHLERSHDGFNPVFMMMTSGARGNRDQMRQLAGHARADGQAAEEAHGWDRRDHRVARSSRTSGRG